MYITFAHISTYRIAVTQSHKYELTCNFLNKDWHNMCLYTSHFIKNIFSFRALMIELAIFSVQLLQYGMSEEKIRSECWVAQDLCHRLDLALRHGLRRPTAGYWPYVRHFTHTDNVKMLEKSCSRRRATLDKSLNV
jgi:hypothetical protein